MGSFLSIFKDLFTDVKFMWQSPARMMLLCYILWVFRVSCVPADSGGLAQALQVGTTFAMLYYAWTWNRFCISFGLFRSGLPILMLSLYLSLGLLSTLWSYKPTYSFFMSFEKMAFIAIFFSLLLMPRTFLSTERTWVMIMFGTLVFNWVAPRLMGQQGLVAHDLQEGSCAAMAFSYCMGEYFSAKVVTPQRMAMLRTVAILCLVFLFSSTSGGANVSAALGFSVALLVSGKVLWGVLLLVAGGAFYVFEDLFDRIFGLLMQGKSERDIQSATGRTAIWSAMMPLADEKPMLGWGYASIERLMSDTGIMHLTDIHNNYYGAYGGTGLVGVILLAIHQISALIAAFRRLVRPGMAGVLSAIACGTLNGYSYGFLAGKTAIISVFYIGFVALIFVYSYTEVDHE